MAWEVITGNVPGYTGYFYVTSMDGETIRTDNHATAQRICAFLNSQPLGWLAGEPAELDIITQHTPDHTCELYDTLEEAQTQLQEYPHHELRGMFILPLK